MKLRPYWDFILDKEIVTQAARQNILMVKYVLHKNPIDTAHNAISFLNSLTEDEIKKQIFKIGSWLSHCQEKW